MDTNKRTINQKHLSSLVNLIKPCPLFLDSQVGYRARLRGSQSTMDLSQQKHLEQRLDRRQLSGNYHPLVSNPALTLSGTLASDHHYKLQTLESIHAANKLNRTQKRIVSVPFHTNRHHPFQVEPRLRIQDVWTFPFVQV